MSSEKGLTSSSPRLEDSSSSCDEEQLKELVVEEEKEVEIKGGENEKEEKQEKEEEEEAKEEDDENENEEEEEEVESGGFTVKQHVPSPQPKSSSSVDDDEEESDDSDVPPPPPSENVTNSDVDPTVDKTITSIPPMDGSVKQQQQQKKKYSTTTTTDQKPQASGTVTPMKQGPLKRTTASEANDKLEEASKKRKKVENKASASKMHWSEDDEVVILKGLLSLMSKEEDTVAKPISEMIHELLENIKPLLEADHVTKEQLYGKIRKLKQKYVKAKTHDSKVLKLAKKIWGTTVKDDFKGEETTEAFNGGVDSPAGKKEIEEGKKSTRSHRTKSGNAVVSPQQQLQRGDVVQSTEQSLMLPSFFNEVIETLKNSVVPPDGLKGFLAKEALGLIGSSKAKDMEEKWNKLHIAEAKIYLDRIDLVKETAKLVLDAMGTEE